VDVASPVLKQLIFMKIKPSQILLGRHPLSDAPYWNPDIMIREQGPSRHHLSDTSYWNSNIVISEQEQNHQVFALDSTGTRGKEVSRGK
jgi:hypothetical protein